MIDLKFDHVSKRYSVRQELESGAGQHPVVRKLKSLRPGRAQDFWAVRDVSFEVRRGESLGIIGHNGAGKSTILKLLSNITTPTSGEITINGRLSALIEVGSGFHPDLSGRENIYLNGAILGMSRREISEKLDRIVDFAGISQFIDTPVKRYSSGMYVRLGFSIAAHLDPDILLLDEVLAVGDAAFQAKCMKRIRELEEAGTTIVFISHDLNAVEKVCSRAILMNKGTIKASGLPRDVIAEYQSAGTQLISSAHPSIPAERKWHDTDEAPGNEVVRLESVRVCTQDGQIAPTIDIRHPVGIEMTYQVLQSGHILIPNYHFITQDGAHLFAVQEINTEWRRRPRPVGRYTSTAWIPGNFLAEGIFRIDVAISTHVPETMVHVHQPEAVAFQVIDNLHADSARGDYIGPMPGVIRPIVDWATRFRSVENIGEREMEKIEVG